MSLAASGHGATVAIELDPVGAPGVFTVVSELNGDIGWPGMNRPESETTPHQDDIDDWVLGRLGRDPLTFTVNYIFDDQTHDHLTGLQKKILDNQLFGIRIRGPEGTDDTDEWIGSGQVSSFNHTDPVREGARSAEVTIRLRKQMKIDGVLIGTAA